jgi:hypothetical protein
MRSRPDGAIGRFRSGLFLATGLAIPLYAFPPFQFRGRDVDLASALAILFVLSCLPLWLRARIERRLALLFAFCAAVPLLIWIPPLPTRFSPGAFVSSYAHWLLLTAFFVSGASVSWSEASLRRILLGNAGASLLISGYALYQCFGIPRNWPGTGPFLFPFPREAFRFTRVGGTYFSGGYTRPTSLFLEPAWLGGYLAWVAAYIFGILLRPPQGLSRAARLFLAIAAAFAAAAILATVSWGAYADFALVLTATALSGFAAEGRRRRLVGALALTALLGVLIASPAGKPIRTAVAERWSLLTSTPLTGQDPTLAKDSTWVRLQNLEYTVDLFSARPARGIGLGQFPLYARPEVRGIPGLSMRDPWCGWAAIAAQLGALGPLILAGALVLAVLPGRSVRHAFFPIGVVLILLAAFVQVHTGSFSDLWWWYPVTLGAVLCRAGRPEGPDRPVNAAARIPV